MHSSITVKLIFVSFPRIGLGGYKTARYILLRNLKTIAAPSCSRTPRAGAVAPLFSGPKATGQPKGSPLTPPATGVLGILGQGMGAGNQRLQPFIQDMGVDLGGGDIGMAQHLLQGPEVGAVGQ